MKVKPEDLKSLTLRKAYDYWNGKRGNRPMPARNDIDPTEMVDWLRHVLLVDVIYDASGGNPNDFSFRLVGTDVVERYGQEFTGQRLSSLDMDGKVLEIMSEYRSAVELAAPQYFVDDFVQHSGRPMHYEYLLMPLSDDGRRINMLLGIQRSLFDTRDS